MTAQQFPQQPIIWVHGDCLNPLSPAWQRYPQAAAIWVWDDQLLIEQKISLKRILFIYECLLELPVNIRRGDVAQEVNAFAREQTADGIITTSSPSPRFQLICKQLELPLTVLPIESLINYQGDLNLKSFSRYWRVVQQYC